MKKKIQIFLYMLVAWIFWNLTSGEAARELYFEVKKEDILLATEGAIYDVSATGMHSAGYMMYFGARDFTADKDLVMKKLHEAKVIVNKPDRKVIKAVFLMENQKGIIDNDYQHIVFLETRKGYPFLAVDSRFVYLGRGTHVCGINWGLEGNSEANMFKYYAYPKGGKVLNYKLGPLKRTQSNKIGVVNWLYAHNGKGEGAGLICAGLLGKGADFIFINSVPQKKQVKKGNYVEVFFITMPISKNYKILQEIYDEIKTVKWVYE